MAIARFYSYFDNSILSSVHVSQIWVSSPESMTGTITEVEKIIEYEEQWHADVFVPCLKKLRAEVCVHELFDVLINTIPPSTYTHTCTHTHTHTHTHTYYNV